MRGPTLLAAVALISAAMVGCSQSAEQAAPPPPPVTVSTPLAGEVVDWDEFPGRFEAVQTVEVRARVGGYIQAVHFRDGDYVRQGQLLFTLDPRQARASAASAQAQVAQAEAQANLARTEFERSQTLFDQGFLSQSVVDLRRANLQSAEAALAAAQSARREAQLGLEYTRVTAPISGRISDRRADPGNLVAGGSSAADVLTTIVSTAPIYFSFDASEAIMLRYQRSARNGRAPLRVRLQDEGTFRHVGYLDFTDNAVDSASGVVRLRGVIPNSDGFLRPGMYGQAQLAGTAPYQAMLVPDSAIVTDQARRIVYVVNADGTTAARPVELGPLVDGLRVIRSGLEASDRVVIDGIQRIMQPGQPVTPTPGTIERQQNTGGGQVEAAPAPASSASFSVGG
ncbi:efflux RND transporter periplasmic adaptor subunit [Brevundimonas aveniformis]|uniref:efflux RND transporter periplasmic adaptor subunit n=1 Tax=Brevundimonas aveniformis TaxID=370977 RepID=UPI00249000BD|nr:efflux RND transporter periplasmic adaptor subunit [Brevundimonas aveniformis]